MHRPSRGIRAVGEVVIGPGRGGAPRLTRLRTTAPLGVVLAGGEVHLMGTAGGPMGGDDLALDVTVLDGVALTVRSVAATIVLPGDGSPSRQRFTVRVGAGASLRWLPEPLVAVTGCDHHVRADVALAADAGLVWLDELVLGRSGEAAGALASTVRVERDGAVLLHQTTSTHHPGWEGPAVTAGARVLATMVQVGPTAAGVTEVQGPRHATVRLAGDVVLTTALGADRAAIRRDATALPACG